MWNADCPRVIWQKDHADCAIRFRASAATFACRNLAERSSELAISEYVSILSTGLMIIRSWKCHSRRQPEIPCIRWTRQNGGGCPRPILWQESLTFSKM